MLNVNFHFPNYKKKVRNESFIKSCFVCRYLHEKYFKRTMDINQIMFRLDDGLVDLLFQTNSKCFKKTISSFHTLLVSFMTDIKKEEEELTLQTQD